MSEHFSSRQNRSIKRQVGTVVTGSLLAISAIDYHREILDEINILLTDKSEVVEGVPGFVNGHSYRRYWAASHYNYEYWLLVEQCPKDVEAAKQGNPNSQSFVPLPGTITEGCYEDFVQVSRGTYGDFYDGEVIVFHGPPTQHLRK